RQRPHCGYAFALILTTVPDWNGATCIDLQRESFGNTYIRCVSLYCPVHNTVLVFLIFRFKYFVSGEFPISLFNTPIAEDHILFIWEFVDFTLTFKQFDVLFNFSCISFLSLLFWVLILMTSCNFYFNSVRLRSLTNLNSTL
uniref:Uncharacterized protein n=1 Tax=Anopheles atroparvus TaxID=41427 RepID=A0AAG5DVL4_ANOAO